MFWDSGGSDDAAKDRGVEFSNHSSELPSLLLRRIQRISDFVTEELHLESRGWTAQEAADGMAYLLECAARVKKSCKEDESRE